MTASNGAIRRVVTTIDENDKAIVLFDGDSPRGVKRPGRGNVSNLLWVTDQCPAEIGGGVDRAGITIGTSPPAAGSVFRIVDYPPTSPEQEKVDASTRMSELAHEPPIRGLPPRHPFMHRTRTIDYAIIMEGEIDMLLDDSEIHLKAGDVLIQQGTNHAWINRGDRVCRIAFVLIDAKAPEAG
jgi:mannose-6-phosphate isomerase-like protein (cupin superfamily)